MTKLSLPRSAPAVLIASVALLLAATGGAVAGGLVTGAQIKNETITSADVKNGSLKTVDLSASAQGALAGPAGPAGAAGPAGPAGADGGAGPAGPAGPAGAPALSGYEMIDGTKAVAANTATSLSQACSPGKKLISATGYWASSNAAVQVAYAISGSGALSATAYTTGVPAADNLHIQVACATLG